MIGSDEFKAFLDMQKGGAADAEAQILFWAKERGYKETNMATSREVCGPAGRNCLALVKDAGGEVIEQFVVGEFMSTKGKLKTAIG